MLRTEQQLCLCSTLLHAQPHMATCPSLALGTSLPQAAPSGTQLHYVLLHTQRSPGGCEEKLLTRCYSRPHGREARSSPLPIRQLKLTFLQHQSLFSVRCSSSLAGYGVEENQAIIRFSGFLYGPRRRTNILEIQPIFPLINMPFKGVKARGSQLS